MALADEIEVGTPRQTIIHFPNGEFTDITSGIHMGTTKLSKALCENGTNVMFGGCVASQFECVLESTENFTNVEIEVYQSIGEFNQPLFVGLVDSCELQSDRLSIKIVAYDKFYNLSSKSVSDWYSNLSFPISFSDMFISLLDYVGLEPSNSLQITQEFNVYETLYGEIKFLDIIRNMCELCGGFGFINSTGKFDIIYLSRTASSPLIVLSGFNLEKYEVKAIDRVKIKSDKTDVGGSFGTGSNIYSVVGNFLCYGKTSQELTDIAEVLYDEISGRTWRPFRASLPISSPNVGCDGLVYNIRTPQGDNFNSYIFSTEFSGTQLFDQNIESFGGEYREEISTTQEQDLTILKMRSFGLESSVEGLKGTVTQVEQQQGVLNESVTELDLSVEGLNIKVENLEKQIGGETKFYETNEPPTFENYPANTWYPDIYYPPDSDATAEDYMFPGEYTWEFTKAEYTKYLGSFIYDSTNNVLYRFILNDLNEFDFEVVEESTTGYILQSLNNLKIESNLLSSELSTQRVIVEDNQLKIIEQGTKIEQTADSILTKVSKGDISSEISQEAGAIRISSNRLAINSDNFTLTNNGVVKAKGADITGNFNMTSGSINISTNSQQDDRISLTYNEFINLISPLQYALINESIKRKLAFQAGGIFFYDTALEKLLFSLYSNGNIQADGNIYTPSVCAGKYVTAGGGTGYNDKYALWVAGSAYAAENFVSASDRNLKKDIESLDLKKSSEFIYSLNPVKFKWKDNHSNRYHHGLIAQEVNEVMTEDWGLYVDMDIKGEGDDYVGKGTKALAYQELIADLIATLQSQNERIKYLENIVKLNKEE